MNGKTIKINLNKIESVNHFVALTTRIPNIIDVSSGRFVVNGKSIMGLFSLDLSKDLLVTIWGELDVSFEYELRKFEVLE